MVCGKMAYSKCSICGIYLYLMENRGQSEHYGPAYLTSTMILFLVWHVQIQYFKKNEDWNYPSLANMRENYIIINKLNDDKARH